MDNKYNEGFVPTYKDIRIDGFLYGDDGQLSEHVSRYYDTMRQGLYAAHEMRRDGYKTYLMYHVFDGLYDVFDELKDELSNTLDGTY